jgi:hypothetical protein
LKAYDELSGALTISTFLKQQYLGVQFMPLSNHEIKRHCFFGWEYVGFLSECQCSRLPAKIIELSRHPAILPRPFPSAACFRIEDGSCPFENSDAT